MVEVYRYQPGEVDWLLLNWLTVMRNSGDIDHTLSAGMNNPSTFLQFFRVRALLYTLDDMQNISRAVWVEPVMGSVFFSMWIGAGQRFFDRESVMFYFDAIQRCYNEGANTIAGIIKERATPQITDAFIRQHERVGYVYSGRLENFFDGAHAHLVAMTREQWENQDGRVHRWWRRQSEHWRRRGQDGLDVGGEHLANADLQRLNGRTERQVRQVREHDHGELQGESADWWGPFAAYAFADPDC